LTTPDAFQLELESSMTIRIAVLVTALACVAGAGCDVVGPSCRDETGGVFAIDAQVPAGGVAAYTVT
jgi:hypothetical protein